MCVLGLTLNKKQRLKSKIETAELFKKGKKVHSYPLLMYYQECNEGKKVMVSVSKRIFSNAVDRNRVKRKLREVYRLNQNQFSKNHRLAIVFVGKSLSDLDLVSKKWSKLLSKLDLDD